MDAQRGRSPSASHMQSHINPSHAPSPQQFQENVNGLGIETNQSTGNDLQNTASAFDNNDFMKFDQVDPNFNQQAFNQQFKQEDQQSPFSQQQQQSFTQELLSPSISSNFNEGDFSLFSAANNQNEAYDPQLFMTELSPPANNPSINPAELNMSSPPNTHSPPGLLQPDSHSPQSAHQSPAFNQGAFQHSPGHSRHASLGPESAAFPQQGHMEWNMMAPQFQGHRRTPSEYSDVSVSSAAPSPNLGQHDSFDDRRHSPMQRPSDHMYQEVLGIGSFSLSDQGRGLSPAHSPAISPRLVPQQLPQINQPPYMIGMNNDFGEPQQSIYPSPDQEFPHIRQMNGSEMGQAQQMVPPEINVEFAPISRTNNFEPLKPSLDQDALTPPDRGRRRRAVSDPYNSISGGSRPLTPVGLSPGAASDRSGDTSRSLSPDDRSGNASPSRRRQSTSSLPNRDYILGLADPDYQAASAENGNAKRVQKHPATFQCTLCPKRFTRAYNLRSHLRTHTDERPFVCTVCGKAFARQHDRKRHEGLHSGEKKFVCKGELKQGGQWGCGRRFARADALGRHFRSEAGRICIKPLLDEEAIERQRVWQEQRVQDAHLQSPDLGFPGDASGNYTLPAALLAQYPALATISWSEIPQGDANDDDPSGRSSFDHSGSEYYDEADDGGYISGEPGIQQNYAQQAQMTERY